MEQLNRRLGSAPARVGRVAVGAAAAAVVAASVMSLGVVGATTLAAVHKEVAHSDKFTVVKSAKFGEVLTAGDTVYTLKPSSRSCTATCFKFWPPVVLPKGAKHPIAGSGVTASKLGTKSVKDVGLQVTYDGHLLYWYYKDTAPGQVNGDVTDTWGKWTPVVLSKSSASPPTSTPGTGGVSF